MTNNNNNNNSIKEEIHKIIHESNEMTGECWRCQERIDDILRVIRNRISDKMLPLVTNPIVATEENAAILRTCREIKEMLK